MLRRVRGLGELLRSVRLEKVPAFERGRLRVGNGGVHVIGEGKPGAV